MWEFKLLRFLRPDGRWYLPVLLITAVFFGMGAYILHISKASSYLSDEPRTCVNCHIMAPQYASWAHSAHREYASCNDCHVPHDTKVRAYYFKAKDGLRHATIFTLRREPQVIHIKEAGIAVVQQNCINCHDDLVEDRVSVHAAYADRDQFKERLCWDCHRYTPHGRVNSISSAPMTRAPLPESPVPDWLKKFID